MNIEDMRDVANRVYEDRAQPSRDLLAAIILTACDQLAAAESQLASLRGSFGEDQMPGDDGANIEVYDQTRCSGMRPGQWSGWPAYHVAPWHLWRHKPGAPDGVAERSAEIRARLGAIELPGNGFWVLPAPKGD